MATIIPEIQNKRADGTYNIRIRVTHNRQMRRLSTNLYASSEDLTKSLKIKNANLIDQTNAIVSQCRKICNNLGYAIAEMSIDELTEIIKSRLKGEEKFKLDFIEFANGEIAKMKRGTASIYKPAINALKRFINRDLLDIFEINRHYIKYKYLG